MGIKNITYLPMKMYFKPALGSIIKEAAPRPKLELTQNQINRLKTASEVLLAVVGVAGLIMVSAVAPNVLRIFKSLFKGQDGGRMSFKNRQRKLTRSFYYLKERDYIKLQPKGKDLEIHLTNKGRKKIQALKLNTLEIKKPLFWDRKFWQVAADIPVQHKREATIFRNKLKQMGFYSLQRTLWFHPYDPRKEINMLTEEYKIDRFVTVMKIASLEQADHKVLNDYFREIKIVEF